jgi:hypothetical protein
LLDGLRSGSGNEVCGTLSPVSNLELDGLAQPGREWREAESEDQLRKLLKAL